MAGDRPESVLFATSYSALAEVPVDHTRDNKWDSIVSIRNEVAKQIEVLRTAGSIGSALDANVSLYADGELHKILAELDDELRFVLITSEAKLSTLATAPESAVQSDIDGLKIDVSALTDKKCVRCWHRRRDVGQIEAHPELCVRCVSNIEGDGESRCFA